MPSDNPSLNHPGEITVQLVFSDSGAPRFRETFFEFYTIALLPYVLDIPHDRVTLILRDKLTQFSDSIVDEEHNAISVDGSPLFSEGYKRYFKDVYRDAIPIGDLDDEHGLSLPVCSIRVISGHGHGNFGGGNITIGRNIVRWPMLGAAPTCLTVLDISSAAYAVAHFEGRAPSRKKWHRFDEAGFFDLEGLTVPVVCDRKPGTYSFRVGFDGQSASDDPEAGTGRMTRAIGDSIVASLICAMRQFVESELSHSLDELFCSYCSSISPALLPYEMMEAGVAQDKIPRFQELTLAPYSKLNTLESLIREGVVSINLEKLKCSFFSLRAEWFLSVERVRALSAGDTELAKEIVSFVVDALKKVYHQMEQIDYHDSQMHWHNLTRRMGPFKGLLTAVRLEMDNNGDIVESKRGQPLEAWASSCAEMELIDSAVAKKIMTGTFG